MVNDRMEFRPHAEGVAQAGKAVKVLLEPGMTKTGRREHEVSAAWMMSRALLALARSCAAGGQDADTDAALSSAHESLVTAAGFVRAARAEKSGLEDLASAQEGFYGAGTDDGHPYAVEVSARVLLPGGQDGGMTVTARPGKPYDVQSPTARLTAGPRTFLDLDAAMDLLGQAYQRAAGVYPWAFDDGEHGTGGQEPS